MTDTYNGWYDWDTWNCALWIGNDEFLYDIARRCVTYANFLQRIKDLGLYEAECTPDGARWADADYSEMNELIEEFNQ
jgi:hypothetical protein